MNFPADLDNIAANKTDTVLAVGDHPNHHDALAIAVNSLESILVGPTQYNVRGAPYNAPGNGTPADGVAINAALLDAHNAGGGAVVCPPGHTYGVADALRYYNDTSIEIPSGAILKGLAGVTDALITNFDHTLGNSNAHIYGGGKLDISGLGISGIHVCGTPVSGPDQQPTRITDLEVYGGYGSSIDGVLCENAGANNCLPLLTRVVIHGWNRHCLNLTNCDGYSVTDCDLYEAITGYLINLSGTADGSIRGGNFYSGHQHAISAQSSSWIRIIGTFIQAIFKHGIVFNSCTNCIVDGVNLADWNTPPGGAGSLYVGVLLAGSKNCLIRGDFQPRSQTARAAIEETGASDNNNFDGSTFDTTAFGFSQPAIIKLGAGSRYGANTGFKTRNTGTSFLAAGATTLVVNHGLDVTPIVEHFLLTPASQTIAGHQYWVTNVTATQFTLNVDAAVGGGGVNVVWHVEVP